MKGIYLLASNQIYLKTSYCRGEDKHDTWTADKLRAVSDKLHAATDKLHAVKDNFSLKS